MFASGTCKGGIIASISVGMGMTTFASLSEGQGAPMDGQLPPLSVEAKAPKKQPNEPAKEATAAPPLQSAMPPATVELPPTAPPNAKCERRHRL